MSNKIFPISYCFAAYNEEEIIESTILKLHERLDKMFGSKNYEILVVENGSTDNTVSIIKKLQVKCKNARMISVSRKSHGLALRTAVENAKFDHIVVTGADLPFGFSDLVIAMKYWEKYDIVFGSKLHPDSKYPTNFKRKISSNIYSGLLNIIFQLGIRDVQGSIFLKRSMINSYLKYCDSDTAFFTTQLAIYAKMHGLKMYEIPVKRGVVLARERKSKYSVSKDGSKMFLAILNEYIKYNKVQQSVKKGML